jgi:hypothetical protein
MNFDRTGLILASRYAFPPNRLHYCGPEKQLNLGEYIKTDIADQGLIEIISQFETLFPYLKLIAQANGIKDPFNTKVVEAYWLGNMLLNKVKPKMFYRHLSEDLNLSHKFPKNEIHQLENLVEGLPNHAFHVLNIFKRTGHAALAHTLSTMDNCRISWGKITVKTDEKTYLVKTRPLIYINDLLSLGKPVTKSIKSVKQIYQVGDQVTVHWDYICDKVTDTKIRNLEFYTQAAIDFANRNRI